MKCNIQLKLFMMVTLFVLVPTLSGCVLATVRTLEEDGEAKAGFEPISYVDEIWESRVLPTYQEQAVPFDQLLPGLEADRDSAIAQYGHRSGTGAYSFMVRGEGFILTFDTSSRAGLATVDLEPPDGTADVSLTIGPLIKISQRASVRDAVGFIEYGNFVNQQEFAGVANAMGDRIIQMIAAELGAETPDAISDLDPASLEGKTISFIGAYTLEDADIPIVVPVALEVTD
jgi:predicted lipoprotein